MSSLTYRLHHRDPAGAVSGAESARSILQPRLTLSIAGVIALISLTIFFAASGVPTLLVVLTSFGIPATIVDLVTVVRRTLSET